MRTYDPGKTSGIGQRRRAAAPALRLHAAVQCSAVDNVSRSPGQPLGAPLTEEMKARPGADFSRVPVHADGADKDTLALRPRMGNAAVFRMLEQARRQHGAGCGQQQAAPAPVQRSAVHDVLSGSGQPLGASLKEEMEDRLGADFSDVRVHTNSAARAAAAEVGARAYTSGPHVVIGDGGADKHTLAHELIHVIQQRRGPVAGTGYGRVKVSDPSDADERAAEATARRVMSGARGRDQDPGLFGRGRLAAAVPSAPVVLTIQRGGVFSRSTLVPTTTLTLGGAEVFREGERITSEASVVAHARLTDPTQRVRYEIQWSANAAPGGAHLGQVRGHASNGWVLDLDSNGNDIGDRGNGNHRYFTEQGEHNAQGTVWSFGDHIVQEGAFPAGAWWEFRLRVMNAQAAQLACSEVVRINWPQPSAP